MTWRNQVEWYSHGHFSPAWWFPFWRCWLDIEMRLFPELHAWRYSIRRFIKFS